MLDVASTNLFKNISERSRLIVTKNQITINQDKVEAADAEQGW